MGVDAETLGAILSELPQADRTQWEGEPGTVTAVELLVSTGLVGSKSEARRTVKEGGAYVNNQKIADEEWRPAAGDLLHGRWLVVRRGKRSTAGVSIAP